VSDIGGPSANMYLMRCRRPEVEAICRRLSCIHPKICPLLETDHQPLIDLLRELRAEPGMRRILVASGVRMDLARLSPEYLRELAAHHVGGHLKVAQEHVHEETLRLMRRPPARVLLDFEKRFRDASQEAGKEQYIVPYFIASHPGSDLDAAIELAVFLKRHGLRPEQVQDFIPAPLDVAACMYHTGLDPITGRPAAVARGARERRWQRALLQHHLPENHGAVKEALIAAGREDLIGDGPGALIPDRPPAPGARGGAPRRVTRKTAGPGRPRGGEKGPPRRPGGSGRGYRPGRRSASRRQRRPEG
ncbi:MAG: DUF3362 domain-containing protein, partial [Planctomycetes bacterium]|nr:DUF3362 domain-containing protein [Planctomycetota bacterium]